MSHKQGVNVQRIVILGTICSILLLVMIVGIQAWFYAEQESERREKSEGQVNWGVSTARFDQLENITTYRWIDQPKQVAAIPIDRAMTLYLERLREAEEEQP